MSCMCTCPHENVCSVSADQARASRLYKKIIITIILVNIEIAIIQNDYF